MHVGPRHGARCWRTLGAIVTAVRIFDRLGSIHAAVHVICSGCQVAVIAADPSLRGSAWWAVGNEAARTQAHLTKRRSARRSVGVCNTACTAAAAKHVLPVFAKPAAIAHMGDSRARAVCGRARGNERGTQQTQSSLPAHTAHATVARACVVVVGDTRL